MNKKIKDEKLDWFPLDVYLFATDDLAGWTNQQIGAYIILLCHQWINGSIPSAIDVMGRIARETPESMEKIWQTIGCKFTLVENRYRNNKLEETRIEQQTKFKKKSRAGEEGAEARWKFVKPTIEMIAAYCKERNNGIDAETFWNHYEGKGWKIGKTPMKSWKATIVTWEKRNKERNNSEELHSRKDF